MRISGPGPRERKLYQLVIPRLDGDRISDHRYCKEVRELVRRGVGGFILFGGTAEDLPAFLDSLQSQAAEPLFIASDIERGVGQQVRGMTSFPCPMAFAAAIDRNDPEDLRLLTSCLKAVAAEARHIGINMPLLPVLDVNRNADNPIICTRAFSDRPDTVAWFGEVFVSALESEGLLCCAKHFPGHGDTATDSHLFLPVIDKPIENLRSDDLPPFRRAVESGVSCVMTGHLAVPCLDERPGSLSATITEGLLRGELGFRGLVLTDALNMGGIAGIGDVAVASIEAGADLLLHPSEPHAAVSEVLAALDSGRISEERINRSLERIREKKRALPRRALGRGVDVCQHRRLSSTVTQRSVTLVKSEQGALPLRSSERVTIVTVGDVSTDQRSRLSNAFGPVLTAESCISDPLSLAGVTVIAAVFTSVAAWKGTSGISAEDIRIVRDLIASAARTIVISFGSPYVLRHFENASVLIAAYEGTEEAQSAVLRVLHGEVSCTGQLPVSLA